MNRQLGFNEIWYVDVNNELFEEERQFCSRIRGANDEQRALKIIDLY